MGGVPSRAMLASASEIIDRLFMRAGEDAESAPLADAFACAYHEGRWTSDGLDSHVGSFIEECLRTAEPQVDEEDGG